MNTTQFNDMIHHINEEPEFLLNLLQDLERLDLIKIKSYREIEIDPNNIVDEYSNSKDHICDLEQTNEKLEDEISQLNLDIENLQDDLKNLTYEYDNTVENLEKQIDMLDLNFEKIDHFLKLIITKVNKQYYNFIFEFLKFLSKEFSIDEINKKYLKYQENKVYDITWKWFNNKDIIRIRKDLLNDITAN